MKSGFPGGNALFFAGLALFLAVYLLVILLPFPALENYVLIEPAVEILDSTGSPLYVAPLRDGMRRQYRPLDEIPPDVTRIFTLAEDKRFFLHPGVDTVALARSVFGLIAQKDGTSGASTITMQLARMVLRAQGPRYGGLFVRKIHEIVTAFRIEARLSKDRILELWLNNIPFGHQTEGVTAAARRYFNRDLYSLTSAQVLGLALIPRNPTAYNPLSESERAGAGVLRLADNLGILLDAATVSRDIAAAQWGKWPDEAPHFSRMVAASVAAATPAAGRITTTLNLGLQHLAERLLFAHLDTSAGSRIENGAVLLVENASGNILAYVGSQGFTDPAGGQIDGVLVRNQPGSTIKPFLYAFALENGFAPNDLLADIPTDFGTGEVYVPRNFDRRYHGPVRLRTSLASSLNVPAISLLELLGVRGFSAFLRDLGFDSIEGNDPSGYPDGGLGMALGNVPVTLYELVRAFSIFPRNGVYRDLAWRHACGLESECGPGVEPGYCAMSQSTAWIVFDMLSDPAERVTGFGMIDPFMIHTKAAVKTGTSSKNQHIWALAATKDYTVGVWLGNFAGQTVIGRTGSSVPAQVALEILSGIDGLQWQVAYDGGRPAPDAQGGHSAPVTGRAGGAGRPPDNSAAAPPSIEICSLSGMTAGPHCPATRREYIEGEAPPLCTFHVAAPSLLAAAVYPAEFASWIEGAHRNAAFYSATGQALEIPSPIEGAVYFYDRKLPPDVQAVRVEVLHRGGEKPVLSVNEKVVGGPYRSNGVLSLWIVPLVPGMMVIEARCGEDRVLRCVEVK